MYKEFVHWHEHTRKLFESHNLYVVQRWNWRTVCGNSSCKEATKPFIFINYISTKHGDWCACYSISFYHHSDHIRCDILAQVSLALLIICLKCVRSSLWFPSKFLKNTWIMLCQLICLLTVFSCCHYFNNRYRNFKKKYIHVMFACSCICHLL